MGVVSQKVLDRFRELIGQFLSSDRVLFKQFVTDYFHSRYILREDVFFDWQYRSNPGNFYSGYSMKVIRKGDEFLGFLGLIPYRLKLLNDSYDRCGALCNLMVDRSCRALGLGAVLVRECQKDFLIMTGTDYNPKTAPMYRRLGNWFEMGDLHRFLFIVDPEKVALLENPDAPEIHKFKLLTATFSPWTTGAFQVQEVRLFDAEVEVFWGRVRSRYPIIVERTALYLNWRYAHHPLLDYRILIIRKAGVMVGYLVSRREEAEERHCRYAVDRIVDLVAEEEAEMPILEAYLSRVRDEQIDCVDFFFTGNIPVRSLKGTGFVDVKEHHLEDIPAVFSPIERDRLPINFIVYIDDGLMHLSDHIQNINNWYITRGDGDKDRPNFPPA